MIKKDKTDPIPFKTWQEAIKNIPGFPRLVTGVWKPVLEDYLDRKIKYDDKEYEQCRQLCKHS